MSENGVKSIFEGNCDANFEGQSKERYVLACVSNKTEKLLWPN